MQMFIASHGRPGEELLPRAHLADLQNKEEESDTDPEIFRTPAAVPGFVLGSVPAA